MASFDILDVLKKYCLNVNCSHFVHLAQIRILQGHQKRVGTVTWNGPILTSGSRDKAIVNHDGTISKLVFQLNTLQKKI